jgi:hypothetical protein
MDLTILNAAKDNLIAKKAEAGVMPADIARYYIPYDEVLAIFTETASVLTELNGRLLTAEASIVTLQAEMANRMLCTKYKTD